MTGFGSELLPGDFFAQDIGSDGYMVTKSRENTELSEARDIAIANPLRWVRVGQTRWLFKTPSAWVSEVNLGQKKALSGFDGTFVACCWLDDDPGTPPEPGQQKWGKGLMFVPPESQGPGEGK